MESALISCVLNDGKINNKIKDELQRAQSIQTESFNFFIKSTSTDIFNKYNEILPKDLNRLLAFINENPIIKKTFNIIK